AATAGAVRTAALIARRERELGLADQGYDERARVLLAGASNLPNWLPTLLDVVEALPASGAGMTRTPTSDIELERMRVLRLNRDRWRAALLGRIRALTYLGRNEDAIATTDLLIALGWYVGDARYWRALNESELERNDEAWTDVEAAAKLLVNADVPKLAGLIAYRRHQLD